MDSIPSFVVVTDAYGNIIYLNKSYAKFLEVNREAQIGKHITEVIDNTKMHIVAKTGKPEINVIGKLKGHDMLVHRVPVKQDGKIVATVGYVLFKDIGDLMKLADKLSLLKAKVKHYEHELRSLWSTKYTFNSIIGVSNSIVSLKQEAVKIAKSNLSVLISGESGTGKELFAQAIHHASSRNAFPFVRINCASIPKDLLESELFGYEKGAFTGASSDGKPGKFEFAHRGTIFLDEIGDLPLEMQPKLLRVIEEKEFERVGGTSLIEANFRLIVATNQNLEEMMDSGRFRSDLFFRLNIIPLYIPPLRLRKDDIMPIARHLLLKNFEDCSLPEIKIDPQAEKILTNYDWPGNVRELSNILERSVLHLEGDTISPYDLPSLFFKSQKKMNGSPSTSLKTLHIITEKKAILQALSKTKGNKSLAANLLGIHRTILYQKMKKYNLPLNQNPPPKKGYGYLVYES